MKAAAVATRGGTPSHAEGAAILFTRLALPHTFPEVELKGSLSTDMGAQEKLNLNGIAVSYAANNSSTPYLIH